MPSPGDRVPGRCRRSLPGALEAFRAAVQSPLKGFLSDPDKGLFLRN